jgi:hypothetical protein
MNSEKPILFSADMINAILEGRKTQIRRVIKMPKWSTGNWSDFELDEYDVPLVICKKTSCLGEIKSPYGKINDTLWVRETWRTEYRFNDIAPSKLSEDSKLQWKADMRTSHVDGVKFGKWRPSIFMPRWASRITLKINNVGVEHLRAISYTDIKAEGVQNKISWIDLWNNINEVHGNGWDSDPWVWVVKFSKNPLKYFETSEIF